jgi:prepilin-type N-terminal cleavage/methylation domain-containing protein
MRTLNHCKGFSLVELLIVIGIIGVLTAILVPSLAHAREQARITKCAANLHQLTVALGAYSVENQSRLPYQVVDFRDWSGGMNEEYGISEKVFLCPEDQAPRRDSYKGMSFRSYAVNNALTTYGPLGLHAPWPAKRTTAPETWPRIPPTVFLLSENFNGGYVSGAAVGVPEAECMGGSPSAVHRVGTALEGGNYAFSDGRAEYVPSSEMTRWLFIDGGGQDPWKWSE